MTRTTPWGGARPGAAATPGAARGSAAGLGRARFPARFPPPSKCSPAGAMRLRADAVSPIQLPTPAPCSRVNGKIEVHRRRCCHGSSGPQPHSRVGVMRVKVYNSDKRFPFKASASLHRASHLPWSSGTYVTPSPVTNVPAQALSREARAGHSALTDSHSFQKQTCGKTAMFTRLIPKP